MLYNGFAMNDKLNNPETLLPGKHYSLWADMKVNGWIFASWPIIFGGDLWIYNHEGCPFWLRVAIALVPLAMWLLWIRGLARWIRGMDELQRRITLEACLFAMTWTFFVIAAWQHLKHEGILEAMSRISRTFRDSIFGKLALGFDRGGLTEYDFYYPLALMLLGFLYVLGHFVISRRYK